MSPRVTTIPLDLVRPDAPGAVDENGNELGLSYSPAGEKPGYSVRSVVVSGGGFLASKSFTAALILLVAAALMYALYRRTGAGYLRSWSMLAAAGAAKCPSGDQLWKGHMAARTLKPMKTGKKRRR